MKSKLIKILMVIMLLYFQGCSYLSHVKAKQGTISLVLNLIVVVGIIAAFIYIWWKKKDKN